MKHKSESYTVQIRTGLPPVRLQTKYPKKMANGELLRIGEKIKHGEYVEIPEGSQGKLSRLIESRGLRVVRRECEDKTMMTIFAVTREWLADNPDHS
jgi:hypothetical protein